MTKRIINYIFGAICIFLGIFFIVSPSESFSNIIYYIGVMLIIFGVIDCLSMLVNRSLLLVRFGSNSAFLNIIFGIILVIFKDSAINIIPYILGSYLILNGASSLILVSLSNNKKAYRNSIIKNIILIILGIIVVTTPIITIILTGTVLGVILIIVGIYIIASYKDENATYKVRVK